MYSILVPRIYSVMNILYQLEVSGQRVGLSLHKSSRLPQLRLAATRSAKKLETWLTLPALSNSI